MDKQKILVVDDEENYRDIVTLALTLNGYEIVQATNGSEGLAAVQRGRPDLILCDVNMPVMNGLELLTALKADPDLEAIPFLFLTGNAEKEDMRKGMQLGADDYLTKPFSAEELIAAVEARLSKKKRIQRFYESQFDDIKSNIVHFLPHEFRTPLNGILGFSRILRDTKGMPEDEVREIGGMILRSGERLQHLLENMVLFGQLQFWIQDPDAAAGMRDDSASSLLEVIRSATDSILKKNGRKNALQLSVEDTLLAISSIHLTKIIEEVVDNAFKFSGADSAVTIASEDRGTACSITVHDTGRGMNEEQMKRISGFRQFERKHYEQQGAGLGLTIAQWLTQLYGGTLTIESIETKGTTVTISLPKVPNN